MLQELKDATAAVFIVVVLQDFDCPYQDHVKGWDVGFTISGQSEAYSEAVANDNLFLNFDIIESRKTTTLYLLMFANKCLLKKENCMSSDV